MCTLVVLNEHVEGYPLIVAANRDERYNRKSRPPETSHIGDNDIVRPWDEERDGTWMGVAREGWLVGITNQDDGTHDPNGLSRGKVVSDCLKAACHAGVARIVSALDRDRYNPFNLVFGRPGAMMVCRVWANHELEFEPLAPGVHVISNDCWATRYKTKTDHAARVAANMTEGAKSIESVVDGLFHALGDHGSNQPDDPFQSLCVHAEEHAFGTRSSSIITVSNSMEVDYWYSEGHPCQSTGVQLVAKLPPRSAYDSKQPPG